MEEKEALPHGKTYSIMYIEDDTREKANVINLHHLLVAFEVCCQIQGLNPRLIVQTIKLMLRVEGIFSKEVKCVKIKKKTNGNNILLT